MTARKPLDDIVVVDLCRGQGGSVAALLLGEAGAVCSKLVAPGAPAKKGFDVWDRNKGRVIVDLGSEPGRATVDAMLAETDVLLHDYPPGEAATLGLDADALVGRHPKLIIGALGAWPASHPLAERPVDGFLTLAELGVLDEQQAIGRDGPIYVRFPLADWGASYLLASGVLARLHVRNSTGKGGTVSTSLAQGALGPMMMHWYRAEKPSPALLQNLKKDTPPSLFECSDGLWLHVMSAVDGVPAMKAGLDALGAERIAELNAGEAATQYHFLPNFAANREIFRTRPRQDWLDDFWANDIAVQPSLPLGLLYDDEQSQANNYVRRVETEDGPTTQPGSPFRVDLSGDGAGPRTGQKDPRRPLEGLKVLDFGMFLAGPFAPMLLADLGAEVIKIEPLRGDSMRMADWVFTSCQRGKRDLAIDLRNPAAQPALRRLIEWADVVHHNLRMPAAEKLGLGYETLRAIKPSLIYAHVSSYGPEGPRKDWPGFDQLFQASAGWEYEGAGEGNPPIWYRFGMVDHQCALASMVGVLAALHAREKTGEGALVRCSLLGAALLTTGETLKRADGTLAPYPKLDHAQMGIGPGRRLFRSADGWVAFSGDADRLMAATGANDIGSLEKRIAGLASAAAIDLVTTDTGTMVPVRLDYGSDLFDDPAAIDAGLVATYPHPTFGRFQQLGAMWEFDDLDLQIDRAPPLLGQHSREILGEIGLSAGEIDALAEQQVILQAA